MKNSSWSVICDAFVTVATVDTVSGWVEDLITQNHLLFLLQVLSSRKWNSDNLVQILHWHTQNAVRLPELFGHKLVTISDSAKTSNKVHPEFPSLVFSLAGYARRRANQTFKLHLFIIPFLLLVRQSLLGIASENPSKQSSIELIKKQVCTFVCEGLLPEHFRTFLPNICFCIK